MTFITKTQASFPKNYIDGLKVEWFSLSSIQIKSGSSRSDDDTTDIKLTSTLTVNLTSSGANGLDTGAEASNRFYFVWLIFNPTTKIVAGLFSMSSSSPTMPSGYTKKRRIGVVRNNASSNLFNFMQFIRGNSRKYIYLEDNATSLRILTGGTSAAYASVSTSTFCPITTVSYFIDIECDSSTNNCDFRPNGLGTDCFHIEEGGGGQFEIPNYLGINSVQYKVDASGNVDISVVGFTEEL